MVVSPSTLQVQTQIRLGEGKKKRLVVKYPGNGLFLLLSSNGKEWHGLTESVVYEQAGLGFCQRDLPRLRLLSRLRRSYPPAHSSEQLPSFTFYLPGTWHQRNSSRCAENQTTHGSQQTGVSLFYLKTVLHYHLQRVRKGFPPLLRVYKSQQHDQ